MIKSWIMRVVDLARLSAVDVSNGDVGFVLTVQLSEL